MPASSTSIEMRLTGVDGASALLDAATERLGRLQRKSRSTLDTVLSGARTAGRALLLDAPRAAIHGLRNGLLGVAAAATAIGYATDRAAARLGTLSDQAAQAGTTADQLQRLATGLQQAGVRAASTEALATAMSRLAKTTGRTGLDGLRDTLAEIAAMPDEAARVVALTERLGKSLGPQFAALVRQGPDALRRGLDGVVAAMPGLSDSVVDAGDAIADGMSSIRAGIANAWDTLLVGTADKIAAHFGVSSRELGATLAAYAEYYAGVAIDNLGPLWDRLLYIARNLPELGRAALSELGAAVDRFAAAHLGPVLRATHAIGNAWRAASEAVRAVPDAIATLVGGGSARDALDAYAEDLGHALAELTAAPEAVAEAGAAWDAAWAKFEGRSWTASAERRDRLDEALAAARNLDESMADLASGASAAADEAETSGVHAANAVRDAWKNGGAVIAGTYEDLRIRLGRVADAASPLRGGAPAAARSPRPAASAAATPATGLEALLDLQREGWSMLRSSLGAIGVV